MSDISVIVLPDGSEFNVKDSYAREKMRDGAVYFGSNTISTSMIMITDGTDGKVKNSIAKYYKSSDTTKEKSDVTVTPNISFAGINQSLSHSVTSEKISSDVSFTPAGTISTVVTSITTGSKTVVTSSAIKSVSLNITPTSHTHEVSSSIVDVYGTFTPSGTISLSTVGASTAKITCVSSITKEPPIFHGTTATISSSSSVKFVKSVASHVYVPSGTIESVVKSFGENAVPVHAYYTAGGEKLVLENCTVVYGSPQFNGTTATITHALTTSSVSVSGVYVPDGIIDQVITNITTVAKTVNVETKKINGATFNGDGGSVTASSSVKFANTVNSAYTTPSITLSTTAASTEKIQVITNVSTGSPSFNGTAQTVTATSNKNVVISISNHSFTPGGTVSGTVVIPKHNHGITTTLTAVTLS